MAPPPGYVAYAGAPTPTAKVSRVKGLSVAIAIVVGIAGVGGLLNGFLTSGLRATAQDFLDGQISSSEFQDELISSTLLAGLVGVATIATMVLVMIWMYRIASNLRAFGMDTTWHPLFAVFGWFLPPVVLYVIPFLMLREQWTKSGGKGENPTLGVWWLAFGIWPLISLGLSAGSLFDGIGQTDPEDVAQTLLNNSQTLTIVGSVVSLVAAVAWILFVRQLTARHQSLTGER